MFIGLCSNETEEEDLSVYDPNFYDPGWGFNLPD